MIWRSMAAGNGEGGETVDIAVPAPGEYGDKYEYFAAPYPQTTANMSLYGRSYGVRVKSTSPYWSDMWIGAASTRGNIVPAGNAAFYNAMTGAFITSPGALGGTIGIGFECELLQEIPAGERKDIPADMWVAFSKVAEHILPIGLSIGDDNYHFRMPPDLENLQLRQIHTGGRAQYRMPGWATTGGTGGAVIPEPELITDKLSWAQWNDWDGVHICPTYSVTNLGYSNYIRQFFPPDVRQDPALYNPYVGDCTDGQSYNFVMNTFVGSGPFTFDSTVPRVTNPSDPTVDSRNIRNKLFGGWRRGEHDIDCVLWNAYCWSQGVSNRKLLFVNQAKRKARCGLVASYPAELSEPLRSAWGWMDTVIMNWAEIYQIPMPFQAAWFDYDMENDLLIPVIVGPEGYS